MKRIIFLFLTLYFSTVNAQTQNWQDALHQWMNSEDMEESYGPETMELLEELAETKINLNQTTREELEQLPFLSAQQVEAIVEYLYRYAPMRSLNELQMITSLDYDTRQLLLFFVEIGPEKAKRIWPTLPDIQQDGRHTITGTIKIPFYERKGDSDNYLGYKYRHDLRYQFNYKNRIKFGLTAAQDAGEPFFANCNKAGYDFYSYYLQIRDMGRLESLNLGMYRVQLGMGLIMNTGFHLGKLATLQSLGRSSHTMTAHASRSQYGYLRGVAATIHLSRQWHLTAFASYRPMDATLNADETARTLLTDGYHRTQTEIDKKSNTHETDLGISTGWRKGTLYINANAVYTRFDRQLKPQKENALYRQYNAEGNDFFNASLDYGYTNPFWSISGETALNRDGALAAIHSICFRPTDTWKLTAIHRYYDKRYTALHASSFSEGSSVQNEHGLYLGATWNPSWSWLLQGYVDYAHFSWARYLVSSESDAFDALLLTRYSKKQWSVEARYRFHLRQRDNTDNTLLINRYEHRLRLGSSYNLMSQLTLRTQADAAMVTWTGNNTKGVMISQQALWQWKFLETKAFVGWFHTDDYDSRLYQYEPSVLYDYSFPAFYGHGIRYSLMTQAKIGTHFMVSAKMGVTNYFDRSVISSGLQQINASSMADLLLQLRVIL